MKLWKSSGTISDKIADEYQPLRRRVVFYELFKRLGILLTVVLLVVVIVTQAILLNSVDSTIHAVRETQQQGSPTLRTVLETNEAVKDCVESDGFCRQMNIAEATARNQFLADTIKASIACSNNPEVTTFDQITKCVEDEIGTRKDYVGPQK